MGLKKQPLSFYFLAAFFGLFVLFLYGPMSAIFILSLQGPEGQLSFPMRGFSFHWIQAVFQPQRVGNFVDAFGRSFMLGLLVMAITVVLSVLVGLAFRRKFFGPNFVFYLTISSLIVPSILVSLGIGIVFGVVGIDNQWYSSALAGHLTWTLPFAFRSCLGYLIASTHAWGI